MQIRVNIDPQVGTVPTNRMVYEAILHRIDRGHDAPFTHPHILRWQNPGRKRAELREWRQGNQSDAWQSLGPAIRAVILETYPDMELSV